MICSYEHSDGHCPSALFYNELGNQQVFLFLCDCGIIDMRHDVATRRI